MGVFRGVNDSNMGMNSGASDNSSKCIFNLLKAFNLCERKPVVKRVTIIKTRVSEGSGDSSGSGKVKSVTDMTEVTNVVMAGTRKEGNLFEKDKLESEINSRFLAEEVGGMGCVEDRESDWLMILEVCCESPIRRNSILEG